MSPTKKQLEEQKRRQREKKEREDQARLESEADAGGTEPSGNGGEVAIPAQSGETDPPAAPVEPYRPQPFTPDLIPEPVEIEAEGDLTPQELEELEHCEAAYANGNRAEWMRWKAAHATRARRLYRQGGRTWPVYCEDTYGESESEVNRRIQQWPLLKAITEQQARPRAVPDSHVQQLLPMVKQHGEEVTAGAYVALRVWAAERRHRVTAEVVDGLVELARAAETPTLTTTTTFQQAIEAQPKPRPKRSAKKAKELAPAEAETLPTDTEPDAQEQGEPSPGSHPNLGDSPTGTEDGASETDATAGGDEDVVDAEIVDDGPAVRTRDALQGMLTAVEDGVLNNGRAETLKEISAAARSIADTAEEILKNR